MGNFRITYTDQWKDIKTIVIEAMGYWDANDQAKKMFGENNVIKVDDLDPPADYSAFDWFNDSD